MTKKSEKVLFDQFYLISSSPKDITSKSCNYVDQNFSNPFLCKSINVLDQYSKTVSVLNSILEPKEIALFCFPSGDAELQLIP